MFPTRPTVVAAGLAAVAVAAGLLLLRGCDDRGPSGEAARQALLDHIAAHPDGVLAKHSPGNMAEIPVEGHGSHVTWGPYSIDLLGQTFQLDRVYGETKPQGISVKGRFVYTEGRWVVEAP